MTHGALESAILMLIGLAARLSKESARTAEIQGRERRLIQASVSIRCVWSELRAVS
jgi:hypothetical protein